MFQVFGGVSEHGALEGLWARWHLRDTMFRFNPGVGTVLSALDLVSDLKWEHDIDWQDVAAVDVGLRAFSVTHGGGIVHPTDAISAHFSLAFALALRLVTGGSAPEDYLDPTKWDDPAIRKVSELVRPYAYDFDDTMPLLSSHVDIRLTDGRTLSRTQGGFRGSAGLPVTGTDVIDKFHANVAGRIPVGSTQAVLDLVHRLEDLDDVRELTRFLVP